MRLDECLELVLGIPQQLLAEHQIVRPARFVDEGMPLLVIEAHLEVGRKCRIASDLVDIFERDIVQPVILELLEETDDRPRILASPRVRTATSQAAQNGQKAEAPACHDSM